MQADVIVIGAGTVGAAIAYGLAGRGLRIIVRDGSDTDHRAARANFGLVWLQGKGVTMPEYQRMTRLGGDPDWEMLDRTMLQKLLPKVKLGPDVAGASFGHHDRRVNPLKLLASLHEAIRRRGGTIRPGAPVHSIMAQAGTFEVASGDQHSEAGRVVISAGLGSAALARQMGVEVPLRPQRGQILVTERIEPILPLPANGLRQTAEGTITIGATQEEAGFDTTTTADAAGRLSRTALRTVPRLQELRVVRQWAGLRVMTPDSFPVYAQSPSHPGAFVALCHSGVTLAALHAEVVADAMGSLPAALDVFHPRRFDVPHAA
jgi:glycine/D-amino acid oxidase-like deaminating enzyme